MLSVQRSSDFPSKAHYSRPWASKQEGLRDAEIGASVSTHRNEHGKPLLRQRVACMQHMCISLQTPRSWFTTHAKLCRNGIAVKHHFYA